MRNQRIALLALSSLLWIGGCQSKTSESKTGQGPQASPALAPQAPASAASKPASSRPGSASPQKPGAIPPVKPPSKPILLTGAPMGGVRFEHAKHPLACATCHHAPRPPKLSSGPQQACTACHTQPPQPGMKTGKQAAFHNPTATAGTCIDCHKKSGGNAPATCLQCHKKENA